MAKFDVKNWWFGNVSFTADIDIEGVKSWGKAVSLAVRWAIKNKVPLNGTILSSADLENLDLKNISFGGSNLSGANLSFSDLRYSDLGNANLENADLTGADLRGANLSGAFLNDAILTNADLRYVIFPEWIPIIQNIHESVFDVASKDDLFYMREKLIVNMAGGGGKVLEGFFGTQVAASLIYQKSDPSLRRIPDFYLNQQETLVDMKRLAKQNKQ